jgi:hypothetical protein
MLSHQRLVVTPDFLLHQTYCHIRDLSHRDLLSHQRLVTLENCYHIRDLLSQQTYCQIKGLFPHQRLLATTETSCHIRDFLSQQKLIVTSDTKKSCCDNKSVEMLIKVLTVHLPTLHIPR